MWELRVRLQFLHFYFGPGDHRNTAAITDKRPRQPDGTDEGEPNAANDARRRPFQEADKPDEEEEDDDGSHLNVRGKRHFGVKLFYFGR